VAHQRGEWWRSGFVCLRDSYHGDTLGSVSVGGIELFHSLYRPLLFDVWQAEPGDADRCARCWPSTPSAARR
jgi:adenosylmethionine-8-amino-7-oxononanoate aminotransferase